MPTPESVAIRQRTMNGRRAQVSVGARSPPRPAAPLPGDPRRTLRHTPARPRPRAPGARRHPHDALERARERRLRLVAHRRSRSPPPSHRCRAASRAPTCIRQRARYCIGGCPTSVVKRSWSPERETATASASRSRVQSVTGLARGAAASAGAHHRVVDARQPAGLILRQRRDVPPQHLHEQHLAHPLQDRLRARPARVRLRRGRAQERGHPRVRCPASRRATWSTRGSAASSGLKGRASRPRNPHTTLRRHLAGRQRQVAVGRPPPLRRRCGTAAAAAAGRSSTGRVPRATAAASPGSLDSTCGSPCGNRITSCACKPDRRRRVVAHDRRPAGAVHHAVELDQVLGAGHDRGDDLRRGRRLRGPRRAALDVEVERTAQPHRAQHVGQQVALIGRHSGRGLGQARRTRGHGNRRAPRREHRPIADPRPDPGRAPLPRTDR